MVNQSKTILFSIFAATLLFSSCDRTNKEFNPIDYFPMSQGNYWEFDNTIHSIKVTQISRENGMQTAELAYFDSLETSLWTEILRINPDQLYWASMTPCTSILPVVEFDPPIPIAPFSKKRWAKNNIVTTEMQYTSSVMTNELKVQYEIVEISDIIVPAGVFFDCIKLKMNFQYLTANPQPFFMGDYFWWFAKDVGPIKYDFPVEAGELVNYNIIKEHPATQPPILSR